eukprot:4127902-Prorocentrum_lima.AAC.1
MARSGTLLRPSSHGATLPCLGTCRPEHLILELQQQSDANNVELSDTLQYATVPEPLGPASAGNSQSM